MMPLCHLSSFYAILSRQKCCTTIEFGNACQNSAFFYITSISSRLSTCSLVSSFSTCCILSPDTTGRSGSDLNVSMDQSHLTPPKRPAKAKPVTIYTGTVYGRATMLGLHPNSAHCRELTDICLFL